MTYEERQERREVLTYVYDVMKKLGYNPINQITGYLVTGDETYITGREDARKTIRKFDRDELIEELMTEYFE
ncbi:MAG: IreB family regulatory phosphoprotein [Lachnospiraceae bacterium]|nr:IreB family regulatory phosphoprotein [Lachnospiraceae bacterium]